MEPASGTSVGNPPPRGLGKEKGEGGAASQALLRFHLHVPTDARASSTIPPEKNTLKPQRLHLLPPRSPAGCPHAGPGHFCRVKRRRRRERGKAAGLGWAACPRRIPAGSTGGHVMGTGQPMNGRCSIHKSSVPSFTQPRRRRALPGIPARPGWSCSSLRQQIPLNSLLSLRLR